ncbi:pteridine-dependent deoxygenase [Dyella sp. C11]|uniref:chorismate transformation enzyme, FkbO/Hyg5 family n=1 Tax=Dyella sp. C11 TaxID=2126991 RepID=UPI000D652D2B|nr:pteridine-dependent deoxygenase [Dyella sp. C11]
MVQGCENVRPAVRRAPHVSYRLTDPETMLQQVGTLAVFGFGSHVQGSDDPRWLGVDLEALQSRAPLELWQVEGPVIHGRTGDVQWSSGEGWLFAAVTLDEAAHGGPRDTAASAYAQLCGFVASRRERHVQRIWNYLADINQGEGDTERYKQFCEGRAQGMGSFFEDGFPAATAIGHHASAARLQVYLLACDEPGGRVENPRQVSAWRYPRQYGRIPPSFARAMTLPAGDALAISGTAAVVGHASAHEDDLPAQLDETLVNLEALLASAGMPTGFDAQSPLKAYVRHAADASAAHDFLQRHLPGVPLLLLHGDICRSELLVEIDGWRYA